MTDINEFILNKLDKLDEKIDDMIVEKAQQREEIRHVRAEVEQIHATLDKHESQLHADVKNINDQLAMQSKLLSDYNESLREHMRRTQLLEDKVEPMHTEFTERKMLNKLKSSGWKKAAGVVGGATAVIGLIIAIIQLFDLL